MKALRSSVSASARRILGLSNGGASALMIRFVLTPVAHGAERLGRVLLDFFSSGTVTSDGKVMSNLPAMNASMRVRGRA